MSNAEYLVRPKDAAILRELGQRYREAAESPRNQEIRRLWQRHDLNEGERPLVLTETDAGLRLVVPDYAPECREEWAQGVEAGLRVALVHFESIQDDFPLEPWVSFSWHIRQSGFGVEVPPTRPKTDGRLGAYHIEPALKDLARDFERLHHQTFAVDRASSLAHQAALEEVFGGVLAVRPRGNPWWTMGLTMAAVFLTGLEQLMVYLYEEPEALHRLLAFLRDDRLAFLDWLEREGLLTLNNENDYIGSGSRGYTRALPQADRLAGQPVRTQDLWSLLESQETVGVGPSQYAEFIFPYEATLAQRFGRTYYGCCEPLHTRWEAVRRLPNLKRVSVSPWCDEEFMAGALGRNFVYSRKPNPSLVSTEWFDEKIIRADLRRTLEVTRRHGNTVEIVMKDVHTLNGEPDRLARWTRLAREGIAEVWGG